MCKRIHPLSKVVEMVDDTIINVPCHVTLVEEQVLLDTQYGRKLRMNTHINDNSVDDSIRLVIWGNHCHKIKSSGSYKFKD